MNLDKICIDPIKRQPWEAIDLGVRAARRWYWPLLISWLIPYIPIAILVALLLGNSYWGLLLLWWLKPFFDRLPLSIASLALFGTKPSARLSFGQVFKQLKVDWFAWLTWRRVSFTRSYDLPVTMLEGLRGTRRSDRLRVLHHQGSSNAAWLTLLCNIFEQILALSILILMDLLIPTQFELSILDGLYYDEPFSRWMLYLAVVIAMPLIAPFYVCSGFLLYINRRIELEAWDIELKFRQMLQRAKSKLMTLALVGLLSGLSLGFAVAPNTVLAESKEPVVTITSTEQAKTVIDEVMDGEEFNVTEEQRVLKYRFDRDKEDDQEESEDNGFWESFFESLADISKSLESLNLAFVLEILIWCLLVAGILWLVYLFREQLNFLFPDSVKSAHSQSKQAEILFGMKVTEESLPDDVCSEVMALWNSQRQRDALALLYRATLSNLIYKHGISFRASYTEGECVRLVRQKADKIVADLSADVTRMWQLLAYGHKKPEQGDLEQLCQRWREVLQNEE